MDFALPEDHAELAALAGRILADRSTVERLAGLDGWLDVEAWQDLVRAGLLSAVLPADLGGADLGFLGAHALLEQGGCTAAQVPVWEALVLGALPLARFGDPAQRALAAAIAADGTLVTAALVEDAADPWDPQTTARPSGPGTPARPRGHSPNASAGEGNRRMPPGADPDRRPPRRGYSPNASAGEGNRRMPPDVDLGPDPGAGTVWELAGVKTAVPLGTLAERLLVSARDGAGGTGVWVVDPAGPGVEVTPQAFGDGQPHAVVRLAEAPARRLGGPGDDVLGWLLDRALAGLASLQAGVCAAVLARTAEHVKTREQFGRPLAAFQAVGQRLADAWIDTDAVALTALQAAWRLDEGLPARDEVAIAKFWAAEAGHRVLHAALHLHGGIGVDRAYGLARSFQLAKRIEFTLGGATPQLLRLGASMAWEAPDMAPLRSASPGAVDRLASSAAGGSSVADRLPRPASRAPGVTARGIELGATSLVGRVAIVTGAGQGLGRAEALALAARGAAVLVNDSGASLDGASADGSPADAVVAEIRAAGGEALAHHGDVATDGEELVASALEAWGRLDVLVNNAGILRDRMVFSMSAQEWDSVLAVHLRGHFATLRAATAHWRDESKRTGAPVHAGVVNTSSEAALIGSPGQPNYAAAKAGIIALTLAVAQSCARYGVRANAICPRARTRMTEAVFGPAPEPAAGNGHDPLAPEHVAPLVAYLASPAAAAVNGQVFVCHGGFVGLVAAPRWDAVFDAPDGTWSVEALEAALGTHFERRDPRLTFAALELLEPRRPPAEQESGPVAAKDVPYAARRKVGP